MRESTLESADLSMPTWDTLEGWARSSIQSLLQQVLEEEVTQLLGRTRYERRTSVDDNSGSRNGHGKPRRLALMSGTIEVKRPRVRGLEERFESRILPLFMRRTKSVTQLLPELYLHGLSQGDFELALRGLLGAGAPLSPSSIARLRNKWIVEYHAWRTRRLDDRELVYAWADGIVRHEAPENRVGCKDPPTGCRSSLDNDRVEWHLQTLHVWQARRNGVTRSEPMMEPPLAARQPKPGG